MALATELPLEATAPVERRMSLRSLLVLSAVMMVINSNHLTITCVISLPLLALALGDRAQSPWPWLLAAATWTPFLVFGWDHFEDHVYLGWSWLLAVGLALAGPEEERWDRLATAARLLVGVTFGVAVSWKWLTPDFRNGSTFEFLTVVDSRMRAPLLAPFSGLTWADVEANVAVVDALRTWNGGAEPVVLARGAWADWVIRGLVGWTLAVETAVAVTFMLPEHWRLSKLRHPALLAFVLSVYAFMPVAGFLVALVTLGLAAGRGAPRWVALYGFAVLVLGTAILVRVLL